MYLTNESVMRRKMKHVLTLTLALSAIIVGFNQCEKGPEEFGQQIMHPDDSISAKYDTTFTLNTQVVPSDSFPTLYHFFSQLDFIRNYPNVLIGGNDNPHFGTMTASFISQVDKADSTNFAGDTLEAVGAHIFFKVEEQYGDYIPAQFNIYQITQDLTINEPYYYTASPDNFFNPQDLISSETEFMGDTLIKVSLTQEFADYLTTADDTTMADGSDFRQFFKGFYAQMEYPEGAGFMNKINITNDTSRLELAIRKAGSTDDPDTLSYPISSSSIRINLFNHNYETATSEVNVNTYLNNPSEENDSIMLVSGLGGPRAKLTIPDGVREKFSQDSNFLARAEIQVKPITAYNNPSSDYFPDQVNIFSYSNDTSYVNISNNQFFNGTYDKEANVYSCNITNYVQAFIDGDATNTLYLQPSSYQTEPANLIFSGSGHKQPIKLRIKYFKP